jgi:mono/diheme cytochrome c family protein
MFCAADRRTRMGCLVVLIVLGWLAGHSMLLSVADVRADTASESRAMALGLAETGRTIFNGKGVCYYCHGMDGRRDQLPQLELGTAALIAQLNPQPSDLRNPTTLRLKTDKQRARAIREGHPGTGMFPDTTITDQELADTLAYLAVLRKEGHGRQP